MSAEKINIVDQLVGRSVEAKNKKKDWTCIGCETTHDGSVTGLWGYRNFCNADCAAKYWGINPARDEVQ